LSEEDVSQDEFADDSQDRGNENGSPTKTSISKVAVKVAAWKPKRKGKKEMTAESSMFQTATNVMTELKDAALASNKPTNKDDDAFDVFGKYVASELRAIEFPDIRQSIKRKIPMAVLEGQESELMMKSQKNAMVSPIQHARIPEATYYFPLTIGTPNNFASQSSYRQTNITPRDRSTNAPSTQHTASMTSDILANVMYETFSNT
jgi:hypothetical protein